MPMIPTAMAQMMVTQGASSGLLGQQFVPFMNAVSMAVCQYISTSSIVTSSNVIIGPGSGTFTGVVSGCIPEIMTGLMMSQAASMGLMGKETHNFFNAISFGVCNTIMTSGLAQGSVIGGGPGAGIGNLSGLVPNVLAGLIMNQLLAVGISGSHTPQLVNAISFGICTYLMTSVVITTVCIGTVMPPPAGPVTIPAAPGVGSLI